MSASTKTRLVDAEQYAARGYAVVRNAVDHDTIDWLMSKFLAVLEQESRLRFPSPHAPETATYLGRVREVQTAVYDALQKTEWLAKFGLQAGIVSCVREILGDDLVLMQKIPFRIDAPYETTEFAAWHQDYFYVRGNEDVVTAWIPMQDTPYAVGCLSVMPGSHKLGPLAHDTTVIKKRHIPANIYDREIRLVEMRKGDLLLFHSCLLHSSNLNISDRIRFSLQPRYSRADLATDASMRDRIPVPKHP